MVLSHYSICILTRVISLFKKIDNILKYSSGTRICIFYYFSLKCIPVVSCIFKEHFKPYLKNILSEKLLNSDLVFKNLLCTCMLTSASQSNTPCSYCLLHFFNNISNTIFEEKKCCQSDI